MLTSLSCLALISPFVQAYAGCKSCIAMHTASSPTYEYSFKNELADACIILCFITQRDNDMALIQLTVTGISRQEFANEQDGVVSSTEMILQQEGYGNSDVEVSLYAVVEADGDLQ